MLISDCFCCYACRRASVIKCIFFSTFVRVPQEKVCGLQKVPDECVELGCICVFSLELVFWQGGS